MLKALFKVKDDELTFTSLPIGIACDASNVAIGAVLFHRYEDGSDRPIPNISKTF